MIHPAITVKDGKPLIERPFGTQHIDVAKFATGQYFCSLHKAYLETVAKIFNPHTGENLAICPLCFHDQIRAAQIVIRPPERVTEPNKAWCPHVGCIEIGTYKCQECGKYYCFEHMWATGNEGICDNCASAAMEEAEKKTCIYNNCGNPGTIKCKHCGLTYCGAHSSHKLDECCVTCENIGG